MNCAFLANSGMRDYPGSSRMQTFLGFEPAESATDNYNPRTCSLACCQCHGSQYIAKTTSGQRGRFKKRDMPASLTGPPPPSFQLSPTPRCGRPARIGVENSSAPLKGPGRGPDGKRDGQMICRDTEIYRRSAVRLAPRRPATGCKATLIKE
ncbi:hypothetical protein LZ32DRAFT_47978 [Colletotrichum eremochloae]|nr:hypothetical protein LZ32DRAFT_47978 [Colletotrichum eremochloae]